MSPPTDDGTGLRSEAAAEAGKRPGPADLPAAPEVSTGRLMGTLTAAGGLAGLVIVLVFGWANPRIEAHRAEVLRAAIGEVLGAPARTGTLFLYDGRLVAQLPAEVDSLERDRVYVGFDSAGQRLGYAITGEQPGYQDFIRIIFGYDARRGGLLGMRVLESKETPGLGDKIEKDSAFVASFEGVLAPIVGVKAGRGSGEGNEVDMITGATISSRTVISIINSQLERWRPLLEAYEAEG